MRSVSMIAEIELEQSAASSNGNILVEFILFYTQSVSKVYVHLPNFVYLPEKPKVQTYLRLHINKIIINSKRGEED